MVTQPNKRSKGEGTWYQRSSDNMWVASIDLDRGPDGKRRRKVVVAKTEAQVKAKLKAAKLERLQNPDLLTSNVTVGVWVEEWFRTIALKKIRPKTAATYRSQINNYIIPAIGKVRLDKLTAAHVRKLHDYITEPEPAGLALSSTTAMQAHRILAVALKYAVRNDRVTRNVATLTDAPVRARNESVILTALHGIRVLHEVASDRLGSRWAAALLTGARQGELLGLELDRVIPYTNEKGHTTWTLDLSWQLQRFSWEHGCGTAREGKPACGELRGTTCPQRKVTLPANSESRRLEGGLWLSRPKSSAGWRIIPLVEPLKSILLRRIEAAKDEPNPHGLVWTSDPKKAKGGNPEAREVFPLDGSPIDPSRDNKAWHAILARAGVPDVELHGARHTTASLLLAAGVPEPIIMKILGHSQYVVTRGYQTVDIEQLERAMTMLSGMLTVEK